MCAHHGKEEEGGYGNLVGVAWAILVMGLSLTAVIILWTWFGHIGPTFSEDVLANQQRTLREKFGLPVEKVSDNPEVQLTPPSLRNVSQGLGLSGGGNASSTNASSTNASSTNASSTNASSTNVPGTSANATGEGTANGATITILSGASVQGNPDYKPDDLKVPLNGNVVWMNEDNVPHTATSGTGAEDPNSGKVFDTSIINGGKESSPVQITGVKVGDEISYYCQIHPYMTSKLAIIASATGGNSSMSTNGTNSTIVNSNTSQEIATNESSTVGNTTSANTSNTLGSSANTSSS